MSFEIRLANGKSLKTECGRELANFFQSGGTSIADAPTHKRVKRDKKGRKVPVKVG